MRILAEATGKGSSDVKGDGQVAALVDKSTQWDFAYPR